MLFKSKRCVACMNDSFCFFKFWIVSPVLSFIEVSRQNLVRHIIKFPVSCFFCFSLLLHCYNIFMMPHMYVCIRNSIRVGQFGESAISSDSYFWMSFSKICPIKYQWPGGRVGIGHRPEVNLLVNLTEKPVHNVIRHFLVHSSTDCHFNQPSHKKNKQKKTHRNVHWLSDPNFC